MNMEAKYDKAVALQTGIFRLIRENNNKRYTLEQQLNGLKEKFNKIKNCYTDEVRKVQRYDLEYIFLFEQYNLNRMILEDKIQKNDLYDKRLEKFSEHINNRKAGRQLDIKRTFYEFNGLVQKEMICNYESQIQILKQKRIMSNKFDIYLECLKQTDYAAFKKNSAFAYTNEQKQQIDNEKNELKDERTVVVGVLSQKFDISDDVVMTMQLASPDIVAVAQKMYPNLKEKMLQHSEKQNINNDNSTVEFENGNRGLRAA